MVFKDKFLKDNILMLFSTSIVNLTNLLYQILIVRKLTVISYGAFNSLLSVFVIFSFPVASLSTMIAKFTSSYNNIGERKKADFLLLVLLRHMLFIGLFYLFIYLVFGFYFRNYLHLNSTLPIYFTGGMLFLAILSALTFGGLQGLEKFIWLSVTNVCSALLKLSLAFFFIVIGWDLLGALGAYLVSQMVGLLVGFFPLREIFRLKETMPDINLSEKYKFVIPSLVTLGCMSLLTNIDVVFVKHFFEPIEAGYYSVAQFIGKTAFFIAGAIYVVMLPRASGLHAQQKDSRLLLKRSLAYTAILCLFVIGGYNLFPKVILGLLTGKVNEQVIFLGRIFSITMTFFSLVSVLVLYQLSISRFKFLKTLVLFSFLQVLAILLFHTSLTQVLLILLSNSIILFILNLRLAMRE